MKSRIYLLFCSLGFFLLQLGCDSTTGSDASNDEADTTQSLQLHDSAGAQIASLQTFSGDTMSFRGVCDAARQEVRLCGNPGQAYAFDAAMENQALANARRPMVVEGKGYWTWQTSADSQLVIVQIDQAKGKNFRNTCIPFEYWGMGNEPFWNIEINRVEGAVRLEQMGEKATLYFPYAAPEKTEGQTIYRLKGDQQLTIEISNGPCSDNMSGKGFDYGIVCKLGDRELKGCAMAYKNE